VLWALQSPLELQKPKLEQGRFVGRPGMVGTGGAGADVGAGVGAGGDPGLTGAGVAGTGVGGLGVGGGGAGVGGRVCPAGRQQNVELV